MDLDKKYDGLTPLVARAELTGLKSLLDRGYTYRATVSGSRLEVGIGESRIDSFLLYDPDGKDAVSYTHLDVYKRQLFKREWKRAKKKIRKELFSSESSEPKE